MKKILIKWFGEEWYCRNFHTRYGIGDGKEKCDKCDHIMVSRDSFLGETGADCFCRDQKKKQAEYVRDSNPFWNS